MPFTVNIFEINGFIAFVMQYVHITIKWFKEHIELNQRILKSSDAQKLIDIVLGMNWYCPRYDRKT